MNAGQLRFALQGIPEDAEVLVVYDEGLNDAGAYSVIAAQEGSDSESTSCFYIVLPDNG